MAGYVTRMENKEMHTSLSEILKGSYNLVNERGDMEILLKLILVKLAVKLWTEFHLLRLSSVTFCEYDNELRVFIKALCILMS